MTRNAELQGLDTFTEPVERSSGPVWRIDTACHHGDAVGGLSRGNQRKAAAAGERIEKQFEGMRKRAGQVGPRMRPVRALHALTSVMEHAGS